MRFFKKERDIICLYLGKKGQVVSEFSIWMILSIIGLVASALIIYFEWDIIMGYLAKVYDYLRYGGRLI
jgi:hypothetical protein